MSAAKNHKITNLFLSALLLIILAGIWLFTQPKQIKTDNTQANSTNFSSVSCVLSNSNCIIKTDHHTITLAVVSNDISAFAPLTFELTMQGLLAQQAHIDFEGIEMFMGANSLTLTKQQDNSFTGTISLPGHAGHGMTWRAVTKLVTEQSSQQVIFEFPLQ
jgi:hypothetical protein